MASASRTSSPPSTSPQRSARILAIDYGRRRMGLAISDELGATARPLAVLVRKNRRDDMRKLRELAREQDVGFIVVGWPVHLDGHSGEMAEEAARFAARLEKELRVRVELRDERLTTWEAEKLAKEAGGAKRKKTTLDSIAAAVLLREYLEEKRRMPATSIRGEGGG